MSARATALTIRIPEGVTFSYPLAGGMTRFLAWAIDIACISVATLVISQVTALIRILSADVAGAISMVSFFVLQIGYGMVCEWRWRGQTIGKRVLRLRVMDRQGLQLQPSQIVIRNLLRFVDSLPVFYLVGGIAMLTSRYAQRLGDFAANTIVVRIDDPREPDFQALFGGKFNSLAGNRALAARLRQRVSPQAASLAMQALLRRDAFEPKARLALFAELAEYFRGIVEFPAEAVEGIGDEQYVRNVVQLLYQTAGR